MKAPWQDEAQLLSAPLAPPPIPEVYLQPVWAALAAGAPVALVRVNLERVGAAARSLGQHPSCHVQWYALGETLLAFAQGMRAASTYMTCNTFFPVHHQRFADSQRNRDPKL